MATLDKEAFNRTESPPFNLSEGSLHTNLAINISMYCPVIDGRAQSKIIGSYFTILVYLYMYLFYLDIHAKIKQSINFSS